MNAKSGLLLFAIFTVIIAYAQATSIPVDGKARFEILSPTLVRMEYSPSGTFIDAPSVSIINRDWPDTPYRLQKNGSWTEISTGRMNVYYKDHSSGFSESTLKVTWENNGHSCQWKPGDVDVLNLGGLPADIKAFQLKEYSDGPGPISRSGYFWLDDSKTPIIDPQTDWLSPRTENGYQDYYFFVYGSNYSEVLNEMAKLTGPVPMLPRYVFGAWFGSRAGYSSLQWKKIVDKFRRRSLPLDVLVLDSDSTGKYIFSGYDWDPEQMPDSKEFFEWMAARGVKVTVNEHYGDMTLENDSNFSTIRDALGYPVTTTQIPNDLTNRQYAELFMEVLHRPALEQGMAFWWQDLMWPPTWMNGLDSFLWMRHVEYEGIKIIQPGKRPFVFSRIGEYGQSWGSHRYGIYFTGDLTGDWNGLSEIIQWNAIAGNNLVPYINNLCGGVHIFNLDPEVYFRWMQFSALSPLYWSHGIWGLRLPWEYGDNGIRIYKKFAGLRYRLLPFIYTYARISHDSALPLNRGMYLEYPDEENSYTFKDQFLFGKELLVAPVTSPVQNGYAEKKVFLPKTDCWFDYFDGTVYSGNQVLDYKCPIDTMPLFVRAGSILPMGPELDYTEQRPLDFILLNVYAGKKNARFTLYEDDGISLDFEKGLCAYTTISFEPAEVVGNYHLTIFPTEGGFQGQVHQRTYLIKIYGLFKPETICFNREKLPEMKPQEFGTGNNICWNWDEKNRITEIRLPSPIPINQSVKITLKNAGSPDDTLIAMDILRKLEQIEKLKRVLKSKHFALTGGADVKTTPRIIKTVEKLESRLFALLDDPKSLSRNNPDIESFNSDIINALNDKPFHSDRKVPEVDPIAIETEKKIADASFTSEEMVHIENMIKGKNTNDGKLLKTDSLPVEIDIQGR